MIKQYKRLSINKLSVDRAFDCQSINKIISINGEGVNTSIEKINQIRRISNLENILNLFEYNHKICSILNIKQGDIVNWIELIGIDNCKIYTKNLLKELRFSNQLITTYHSDILPKRISLYKDLTSVLDSKGNVLEIPEYSHASVSGRTTILNGYNFLTSTKEFRKSCTSINSEHLVSIDFKACEPNLYLRAIGKKIKNSDVYNHLMNELNIKVDNRAQLKRGILSVLYGASDDTAKRILGGNKSTLEDIKQFFEIEEKTKELQKEFDKQGFIFNMYGRPIFSDKSILNKWIQSSAVDFCSLAFLDFSRKNNLRVAYLIHDDMVVNCSKKEFQKIKSEKSLQDPLTKISLPVEITMLNA
jgi:hypothetical protein